MNCNFLPKAAKEFFFFALVWQFLSDENSVCLWFTWCSMFFGLESSDLTTILTVIGQLCLELFMNSLKLKRFDVVWSLPALEHNHFSPKIVKYFTYIVGAMWWGMGRNSEIFIITIRLEQTRSVTWRRKNIFLWIIHCQEEAWIYRKVWARMIF